MRIGIDARFYGSIGKGLGRYTQKLIENLEKIDKKNQYFIFLLEDNFQEYEPKNENFKKIIANYRWYTFSEQLNMPRLLNSYNLDIVHFPHFNIPIFYRKKFAVTIHDLILIHFPTVKNSKLNFIFYWIKFLSYKLVIGLALKRSEIVFAVSEFTKKDILANYNLKEDKVWVTYESCDWEGGDEKNAKEAGSAKRVTASTLEEYGIIKPYLLYVGNAYPHKNLDTLIDAWDIFFKKYSQLHPHDKLPSLVLVGGIDYFYNRLSKDVVNKKIANVIFTGFIPDSDLDEVYREGAAYVFPSLYEGFGLPPLEAMNQGLPVISSYGSCLREILGESVYYFDGRNKDSMAQAINEILTNNILGKNLIDRGYQKIREYSWKKMARETKAAYEKII